MDFTSRKRANVIRPQSCVWGFCKFTVDAIAPGEGSLPDYRPLDLVQHRAIAIDFDGMATCQLGPFRSNESHRTGE